MEPHTSIKLFLSSLFYQMIKNQFLMNNCVTFPSTGKATVIMDNAPQHKAGILKEFLNKNPNVKVIWLPTATPELSVVEKYWHQSKRDVLVSEYYATVVHMHRAVSEYFRTARPKLDAMKFICRKSLPVKNF